MTSRSAEAAMRDRLPRQGRRHAGRIRRRPRVDRRAAPAALALSRAVERRDRRQPRRPSPPRSPVTDGAIRFDDLDLAYGPNAAKGDIMVFTGGPRPKLVFKLAAGDDQRGGPACAAGERCPGEARRRSRPSRANVRVRQRPGEPRAIALGRSRRRRRDRSVDAAGVAAASTTCMRGSCRTTGAPTFRRSMPRRSAAAPARIS